MNLSHDEKKALLDILIPLAIIAMANGDEEAESKILDLLVQILGDKQD
jgi:hypothetical protein